MVVTVLIAIMLLVTVFDLSQNHLDDETRSVLYYEPETCNSDECSPSESAVAEETCECTETVTEDAAAGQQIDDEIESILNQFKQDQKQTSAQSSGDAPKNGSNHAKKQDTVSQESTVTLDDGFYDLDDPDDDDDDDDTGAAIGTDTSALSQDEINIRSQPLSESEAKQDVADLFSKFKKGLDP